MKYHTGPPSDILHAFITKTKNYTAMHHAMMRKCAMFLLAIFGFTAVSLAQTVTGTVTDKKRGTDSGRNGDREGNQERHFHQ